MAKQTSKVDFKKRVDARADISQVMEAATRYSGAVTESLALMEALHEGGALDALSWIAEYKDAVFEAIRVLELLHERGVLKMLIGMLEQWSEVSRVLVDWVSRPESTTMIKNGLFLMEMLGHIDPDALKTMADATAKASKESSDTIRKGSATGPLELLALLTHPDVLRGMGALASGLKGVGEAAKMQEEQRATEKRQVKGRAVALGTHPGKEL